jgi:hypothetical protein
MANEKYMRELRKKKQKDTGAAMPGSQTVSQTNAPSAQSMGGGLSDEQKFFIRKGQDEAKKSDFFMRNRPPSMRRGAERQEGRMTRDTRSVSDIGGDPGLLTQLDRMSTDPSKNTVQFADDSSPTGIGTRRVEPMSDKADAARQTKMREDQAIRRRDEERGFTDAQAAKAKKDLEDIYGQFGMEYEEGGQVKAKVMSMLDGMKDMPAEAEVVKMIVDKHGVSEDEAKAMIAEYKQSKMGMGGKMEYEGGGAMKMMRDPKDMVGMAMGGAKIIS